MSMPTNLWDSTHRLKLGEQRFLVAAAERGRKGTARGGSWYSVLNW